MGRGSLLAALDRTPAANQPESPKWLPSAMRVATGRQMTTITRDLRVVIPKRPASMSAREYIGLFSSDLMTIEYDSRYGPIKTMVSGPEQAGVVLSGIAKDPSCTVKAIHWVEDLEKP